MTHLADLSTSAVLALTAAGIATVSDLWKSRVPNWLTYSTFVLGFLAAFLRFGAQGLAMAGLGAVATFVPAYIMFVARGMKGGDVKLLAALGAALGVQQGLAVLMLSTVFGSVVAIAILARHGALIASMGRVFRSIAGVVVPGVKPRSPAPVLPEKAREMHFAPAIALATFVVVSGLGSQAFEVIR